MKERIGPMGGTPEHVTQAYIHLDRLSHNARLLQQLAGDRPLWPAIKANAYGHGTEIIARHLVGLGYDTLCVAHVSEARALREAGVQANFIVLSATLANHAEALVALGCEPVVCTREMIDALAEESRRAGTVIAAHLKVDTGMGRIGVRPDEVPALIEHCRASAGLRLKGIMSHFACADEADKAYSLQQLERFRAVVDAACASGIELRHMANSAAILDLPDSLFDAVRPGIALYGLAPSAQIANPIVKELRPVLEWTTRVTFLKEVTAGTPLSYGRDYYTDRDAVIATVPVGYGDGLSRRLSNACELLVRGVRCPLVGRITMDQSLLDVTALRGQVELGDRVVILGCQGDQAVSADEFAETLGTINYEIVTAIAARVPRVPVATST